MKKRTDTPSEMRWQYRANVTYSGKTFIEHSWIEAVKQIAEHLGVPLYDFRVHTRATMPTMSWYLYVSEAEYLADIRNNTRIRWRAVVTQEIKS